MNNLRALKSFYITIIFLALFTLNGPIFAEIKEYPSSDRIAVMCKELSTIIKTDEYHPDLLIGLSRGGLQPLGLLAGEHQLNMRHVSIIALKSYEGSQQGNISLVMPLHLEDYKKYKSILVIDDLVDSGKTMDFVKSLLEKELPESSIKTAVLYYKSKTSKIKPDYYVEETDNWIVFPWEN